MTLTDRTADFFRRNRAVPALRREPRDCRCRDCGRTWPERESEAAYAHCTTPGECPAKASR